MHCRPRRPAILAHRSALARRQETSGKSTSSDASIAEKGALAREGLVLPDRIELSTSPLPMECSTTELRQRAPDVRIGQKGPYRARRSLPQGPYQRKRADRPRFLQKAPKSAWSGRGRLLEGQLRPDPVPHFLAELLHLPILAANSGATSWERPTELR